MKYLFTSLFILPLLLLNAQEHQFPMESVNWSVVTEFPTGDYPFETGMYTETYGYDGQTLLNGKIYHDFYLTWEPEFVSGSADNIFQGHMYEEENVVYFMYYGQAEPAVLYDFNLEPGDPAPFFVFCCGSSYPVTLNSIDSVLLYGEYRRRFIFDTIWDYTNMMAEVWIEGIGSIHGPLFPSTARLFSADFPDGNYLSCFSHDGEIVWQNPRYARCYNNTLVSVDEFQASVSPRIYPNPAREYIRIEPYGTEVFNLVSIYNANGLLVRNEQIDTSASGTYVNLLGLKPGLYLIKLSSTSTHVQMINKFVIR